MQTKFDIDLKRQYKNNLAKRLSAKSSIVVQLF